MLNLKRKIFIILETILYVSFVYQDLFKVADTTYLKYSGIILCFIFSILNKQLILSVSSFFTVCADFFLLGFVSKYEIGVSFFICVQLTFIFHLKSLNIKQNYILRILIPSILTFIVSFIFKNLLYSLTIFYFSQMIFSLIYCLKDGNNKLLIIGLCLFILCDICVGLCNITKMPNIVWFLQWAFYLPSQVLIYLSFK